MGTKASKLRKQRAAIKRIGLDRNYGAMIEIMKCLHRFEQLTMQQLDKWWYSVGVGRVQISFKIARMFFFPEPKNDRIVARSAVEVAECRLERMVIPFGYE